MKLSKVIVAKGAISRAMPTMLRSISIAFVVLLSSATMMPLDFLVSTVSTEQNDREGSIDDFFYQNDSLSVDRMSKTMNDQSGYDRSPTQNDNRGSHVNDLFSQHDFLSTQRMIKPSIKHNTGYVRNTSLFSDEDNFQFNLLDDLYIENEKDLKSFRRLQTKTNITGCVRNQKGLEIAIMNAPDYSLKPTNINICKEFIYIDASIPNVS